VVGRATGSRGEVLGERKPVMSDDDNAAAAADVDDNFPNLGYGNSKMNNFHKIYSVMVKCPRYPLNRLNPKKSVGLRGLQVGIPKISVQKSYTKDCAFMSTNTD
jgi:hypothetical protein